MVEEALKVDGVLGSRMTGEGVCGCTVSIVKEDAIDEFIKQVGKNYEERVGLKQLFIFQKQEMVLGNQDILNRCLIYTK